MILGSLIVTFIGEYFGCKLVIKKPKPRPKEFYTREPIIVSNWKTILLTIIFLIVGIMRYRNLYAFAREFAGIDVFQSTIEMMTYARMGYVQAGTDISLGGTIANQFVYISEICTYIYIFIFLYNLLVCKRKNYILLLPIFPDLLIRFVTTTRSVYIILVVAIAIAFIAISQRIGEKWIIISPKLFVIMLVFAVVLIWYGRLRNNVSISTTRYIQMYTCSSLYALDSFLMKHTSNSPYFGFYTMQSIYSFLGIKHSTVPIWNPDVIFGKNGAATNIYTCLYDTVSDYGILGMLFVKFFEAIIAAIVVNRFLSSDEREPAYYILIYFVVVIEYCYFEFPVGHVFSAYFGSPDLMLRYLIYAYIVVKLVFMPTINGRKLFRISRRKRKQFFAFR